MYDCCLVIEDGRKCNKRYVHTGATTRMNEHLFKSHGFREIVHSERKRNERDSMSLYLVYFIISASLPFRIVENKYFKLFVNSLNSNFKVPTRDQLRTLINH